jgi:hypothetical protein
VQQNPQILSNFSSENEHAVCSGDDMKKEDDAGVAPPWFGSHAALEILIWYISHQGEKTAILI